MVVLLEETEEVVISFLVPLKQEREKERKKERKKERETEADIFLFVFVEKEREGGRWPIPHIL